MTIKTYKITEGTPYKEELHDCDMIIVTSLGSIFLDAGQSEIVIHREDYDFFSIISGV